MDFTCRALLEPPAAPTGTPSGAQPSDTTSYLYQVVSTYKDAKNVVHDSPPSDPSEAVVNAATISANQFNTVTWEEVAAATGYKVLRAKVTGTTTSAYTLVGTIAAGTTVTFDRQDRDGNVVHHDDQGVLRPGRAL